MSNIMTQILKKSPLHVESFAKALKTILLHFLHLQSFSDTKMIHEIKIILYEGHNKSNVLTANGWAHKG